MAERISWYQTPVDREVLRSLTARSDAKGLIQTLGFILILCATGTIAVLSVGRLPVWAVLVLVYVHGTVWTFHINAFHELVHGTVFKSAFLNNLFLKLISFTGVLNPYGFKASHTRHHLYTLHDELDGEVVLPIKMGFVDFLRIAIVDPVGLYHEVLHLVRSSRGIVDREWIRKVLEEDGPVVQRRYRNWSLILLVGHGAIIAVSVVSGWWMIPVVITFARFYGRGLQYLCNETQHVGLKGNTDDFRYSARSFTLNPVLRFVYWHMNYHLEHHMYAAVPCYNLKRLNAVISHDLPTPCRGLFGAWREIVGVLRKQTTDPGFTITKEVPN